MSPFKSRIVKLHLFETGTYNDLVIRPYTTHVDGTTFSTLAEATHNGTNLSSAALSGVTGDLLRPQTQGAGIADIIGSLDSKRYRFTLEVEANTFGSSTTTHYFSGYTSHMGITPTGAVDATMKLYFNSCMTVDAVIEATPCGNRWRHQVTNSFEYIPKAFGFTRCNQERLIRPSDVFNTMAVGTHLAASLGASPLNPSTLGPGGIMETQRLFTPGGDMSTAGLNVISSNHITSLETGSRISGQSNNLSGKYLANILKSNSDAMENADEFADSVPEVLQSAASCARTNSGDAFFHSAPLAHELGKVSDFSHDCGITWGNLSGIFPEMLDPRVTSVNTCSLAHRGELSARGVSELWTSQSNEAIGATIIASAMPAILTQCALTHLVFTATNITLDGSVLVSVKDVNTQVRNIHANAFANKAKHIIESHLMPDVTIGGRQQCFITVNCDVFGDTIIHIAINGQPTIMFQNPTWCSGLSNRVVSSVNMDTNLFTSNIQMMVDTVQEMAYDSSSRQQGVQHAYSGIL